jgi:putative ABC transport system substrate-binding protein
MRRREFITLLGGTAAAWPLAARAQPADRVRRIGMLIGGPTSDPSWGRYTEAFKEELAKRGWNEGRNLLIDLRVVVPDVARSAALAAELVDLAPDVIFASTGIATRAAQQETKTIPIVFTGPPNVVGGENIARPTGNITGFDILYPSIGGKWVELLKRVDARVSRIAYINNPGQLGNGGTAGYGAEVEQAGPALGLGILAVSYRDSADLEGAIATFAARLGGGLIVLPNAFTSTRESRDLIQRLAETHRLPTIHWNNSYPAEGGLMSYGSDFEQLSRRAAGYVDRILRGAKVSDLPIERPSKLGLVINLKAAKAIGLTVPPSLLATADEVIE